ncbi:hypothetical protein EVB55_093 [Rhizobium phage RHph_Y68]|uniref:Uncharacterized protein n=1 Tax=Rhizobium phage RHph_Y68 TaxID=2509787 RepID=A0A7S5USB0_9CAUD|nr:hypothetical protein PP934_gp093 [Rhizobium phage RHph_Y68]QIG68028.1 hypothetical protein EVB55_093 [Rhizobium phage RHph_Y68]
MKTFEILPPLSINEIRTLVAEGKFSNRDTNVEEFQKCIEQNPYIYDNDVSLIVGDWLYVYGPGDGDETSFYAEYITEEGQLDYRADDNASEWEVVNNEIYEG